MTLEELRAKIRDIEARHKAALAEVLVRAKARRMDRIREELVKSPPTV